MVFIIRVRAQKGMKRMVFKDDSSTLNDLQLQIKDIIGLSPSQQLLSKTPLSKPDFVQGTKKSTLKSLGFKHGDMLYLGGEDVPQAKEAKSVPIRAPRLTARCQHGPRGQCMHCNHAKAGDKIKGKCAHGPNETCIHCGALNTSGTKEIAEFWCSHPETAFCVKCMPPPDDDDGMAKQLSCSCDPRKGEKCLRCIGRGKIKTNFCSFFEFMERKKGLCKYKHASSSTCINCRAPVLPSYAAKPGCTRGHRPWPEGVCLSCRPETPHLRLQRYRHCDTISIPASLAQNFYHSYVQRGIDNHRVAFFFGRYVDEPPSTKIPGGKRAVVEACYEPPQQPKPGRFRFLRDPKRDNIHKIAEVLGIEMVGMIIARKSIEDEKYKGKVFLTGREVRFAAQFQQRYVEIANSKQLFSADTPATLK